MTARGRLAERIGESAGGAGESAGGAGKGAGAGAGRHQRWVGMLKSARSRAPDGQRWVIVFSRV